MTCFFHNLNHGECSGPAHNGYCALHLAQSVLRAAWDTTDRKPKKEFLFLGSANPGQTTNRRKVAA